MRHHHAARMVASLFAFLGNSCMHVAGGVRTVGACGRVDVVAQAVAGGMRADVV